ncbi:MAG: TolC family protein [Micavibrio sp.]|nr:TolC family protein [Micavibrio sp.]
MFRIPVSTALKGSCCFVALLLLAPCVQAETLREAIQASLVKNPTLEQALATQTSAQQDLRATKSNYYPSVSLSTAAGRVYGNNATSRGFNTTRGAGYSNMWEGSVTLNQMIFDSMKTPRLVDAAEEKSKSAELDLQNVRETLVLQTTMAYLNALRTRQSLDLLIQHQDTLKGYENQISKMVNEGMADDAELQQAKALGIDIRDMISEFQGQVRATDAEYARLTGHIPEGEMKKPESIKADLPSNADQAISESLISHPQIKKLEREVEAAKLTRKAQNSALYPTVSGELSAYRKDVNDIIGGEVEDNRALIRLNWSLSSGGAELAQIEKAAADERKSRAYQEEVSRQLKALIQVSCSDMMTADEQLAFAQERLETSQNLLSTYKVQFEGGKVRALQILQGENQVLRNKMDVLNNEYRSLAAQYAVLGAMGKLQEKLALTTFSHDQ